MKETANHSRQHWVGDWHGDRHTYHDKIPIVATTLDRLREHGPTGTVFWRFGRPHWQSLTDAIGNPRRDAAQARQQAESDRRAAEYRAEQQRLAEEKEREREAKRPVCLGCATKFTDERGSHVQDMAWYRGRGHPPASVCGLQTPGAGRSTRPGRSRRPQAPAGGRRSRAQVPQPLALAALLTNWCAITKIGHRVPTAGRDREYPGLSDSCYQGRGGQC